MTQIGYAAMLEQFHPTELLDWCAAGGGGRLLGRLHGQRALPPMDAAAGPERLCVEPSWARWGSAPAAFGVAVTCPGFRYHPAVIAHAAATLGAMYPGRFWLGLGAGEALNEHIIGGEWPEVGVRSAMLFEAIEVITKLFSGDVVKHDGEYFTLASAKLYTRPEKPVPIYVATAGPVNAKRTGRHADGMITVGAADEKIRCCGTSSTRAPARGKDPPPCRSCSRSTSRGPRPGEAEANAMREWPNGGMPSRSRTSGTRRISPTWRSWCARSTSPTGS